MLPRTFSTLLFAAIVAAAALVHADEYVFLHSSQGRGDTNGKTFGFFNATLVSDAEGSRPIAIFGACKPMGKPTKFLYLLILKTPANAPLRNAKTGGFRVSGSSDGSGDTTFWWNNNGEVKVEISHAYSVDAATRDITESTLKIGGTELGKDDPRVFVVDLTGPKAVYHPLKIALPKAAPNIGQESSDKWGRIVVARIAELKKDEELRKLLGE